MDPDPEIVFRRFLFTGIEEPQYFPTKRKPDAEWTSPIHCLDILRQNGKGCQALAHLKEVHKEYKQFAHSKAILLSLAKLVRALPTEEEMPALPQADKTRKPSDKCLEARNAVLEICTEDNPDDLITFFRFYKMEAGKGEAGVGGRGMRRIMACWYNRQNPYTSLGTKESKKYHKTIVKQMHIKPKDSEHSLMLYYLRQGSVNAAEKFEDHDELAGQLDYYKVVEQIKTTVDAEAAVELIQKHSLTLSSLPLSLTRHESVWCAVLKFMPLQQILDNLKTLNSLGFLKPNNSVVVQLLGHFQDTNLLEHSKLQPAAFLIIKQKALSHWDNPRWPSNERVAKRRRESSPRRKEQCCDEIPEALDKLFYASYVNLPHLRGKRVLICVDVRSVDGTAWRCASVTTRKSMCAIILSLLNAEGGDVKVVTWHGELPNRSMVDINVRKRMKIDQVDEVLSKTQKGAIDYARPIKWAEQNNNKFDSILVLSGIHTHVEKQRLLAALHKYRTRINPNLRYIACVPGKYNLSIADKNDARMLDVGGFDQKTAWMIASFINEKF